MNKRFSIIVPLITFLFVATPVYAQLSAKDIQSNSGNTIVSPGESVPVLVKLANFGSDKRVDVLINYSVFDQEKELIIKESETVAVETSAQFVRHIALPHTVEEGLYSIETEIHYQDQEFPAISSFNFAVEKKYFGVFKSNIIFSSYIAGILIIIVVIITLLLARSRKTTAILHDYSNIDEETRIYYEIISDVVTQMRLNIGNKAIDLAQKVGGIEINPRTGKIISLNRDDYSEIVSDLVSLFEKTYGSRVNISLKKGRAESRVIIK